MKRLLGLVTGLLLVGVWVASCGLPATQGVAGSTDTPAAPPTTALAMMTSLPEATTVPSATLTPLAPTPEPTGTFGPGGMIIPTKTLHPEGYTFEDGDIRSELTTLRPEWNELQAPFATALRGTAEALGRFPSATPWPFPVTPNPTPILDSWIVGDPETQASALGVYLSLVDFVAASGQLSVNDFATGLKEYLVVDAESMPGMYCHYSDIVDAFRTLKNRGQYARFEVPEVRLVARDPGLPIMKLNRDNLGYYFAFMRVQVLNSLVVEVVDEGSGAIIETQQYQAEVLRFYFYPRLETSEGTVVWKLYSGEVPIGCIP